jgi:hypothetical protein
MDLFDLFVTPQRESERIKRLSNQIARRAAREKGATAKIRDMESDVGLLALVVLTLIRTLSEKGLIREDEFLNRLLTLDKVDGALDGKIDPDLILDHFGLARGSKGLRSTRKRVKRVVKRVPKQDGREEYREASASAARAGRAERRRRSKERSRTAAFGPAGTGGQPAAGAPEPAAAPEMAPLEDLQVDAGMDPSKLGEISFEDYFGGEKE